MTIPPIGPTSEGSGELAGGDVQAMPPRRAKVRRPNRHDQRTPLPGDPDPDADNRCPTCGKPVVYRGHFGGPKAWEHAFLRDTPVPWHDPTPTEVRYE